MITYMDAINKAKSLINKEIVQYRTDSDVVKIGFSVYAEIRLKHFLETQWWIIKNDENRFTEEDIKDAKMYMYTIGNYLKDNFGQWHYQFPLNDEESNSILSKKYIQ